MKKKAVLLAITSVIEDRLAQLNISATVKHNLQPSVLDTTPTIYLSITTIKYKGFPKRSDLIKATEIEHLEGQVYESTINITGQAMRDTSLAIETLSLNSLDLTHQVATVLQSDQVRTILKKQGFGVMKIDEIRQSFYSDNEANRNQTFASFNFTVCYEEVSKSTSPITNSFEFNKYRV